MHNTYVVQGLVDSAVAHAQADKRLRHNRNERDTSEETIVHAHAYDYGKTKCNLKCMIYHYGRFGKPHNHSVGEQCPTEEAEETDG